MLFFCFCFISGAACVVFSSHTSYIAAVSARFVQLSYAGMDKKVRNKHLTIAGFAIKWYWLAVF